MDTVTDTSWLSGEQLELMRAHVPVVYVEAVPVRVDALGNVTRIGLLLRVAADGSISRLIVSGRVKFGERVREALLRHCEKDLGPLALPRIPVDPAPFTVVEYFPDPDKTGYHDPRQHAVSLVYVVPVDGECEPTQEALDLAWFTPSEAASAAARTGCCDWLWPTSASCPDDAAPRSTSTARAQGPRTIAGQCLWPMWGGPRVRCALPSSAIRCCASMHRS